MNKSDKDKRKSFYRECASRCNSLEASIEVLIDKIVELEESVDELQYSYRNLLFYIDDLECVHLPF